MNKSACIDVQELNVKRGKNLVLDQLSFQLEAGKIIGLLGPSGSGKSTLLRSIVGNQIITSGTVTVLGLPSGSKALRHKVGYMTQAASVYDDLTVTQNVAYFAKILGLPDEEVNRVIQGTDLSEQASSLVIDLSGGQRNRVSLAIALLGSPEIVILDEPTVGLDPVLRADLWGLFARLAATGLCLVVSSHVMDEAMRCDQILLLREGKILAQLTPYELMERTGATDPETAFLKLIDTGASNSHDNATPAPDSAPRHRASSDGSK
ncbi:ABC transporter ATP-binding protein [Glutamicibacter halophytocola]|uniref:ABC transporter ATP-binding protein n=1 Tax=Glutamicibacter halophytocola TaxID=1933880 RepID=UPI001559E040|nr:ABC transporter ATP-binding protein [Glutamicibacter halophytocola]NQD41124.1 ABC transporter ATP-binding protein [Glutamicibacter halophytocola]